MPAQLRVSIRGERGATVLRVVGELDLASYPELESGLEQALDSPAELVVLDLSELEFMDVVGLRAVLRAEARVAAIGRRLVLAAPSAGVKRLLALTGKDQTLRSFGSVAEAVGADLR